jgi:hypothetical protein
LSTACETIFHWLAYTFGNERAARELEEKWREQEG